MSNSNSPLKTVKSLKAALSKVKPQHDTPIGLIHPYWARKPLNIIDTIIVHLSKKGDIVYDPFSGSGTIPFSALANKRKALASDLNPLSIFITSNILEFGLFEQSELELIKRFFLKVSEKYSSWFCYQDKMIERIRYEIKGEYKNGNFSLLPVQLVCKSKTKLGWRGRDIHSISAYDLPAPKRTYVAGPIKFDKIRLPENSRIAIPQGALLSHFFDESNIAAINCIYSEILKTKASEKIKRALLFILSSSLPLLRLSDKKATSQWPYWRPKTNVTSRNPLFVIEKRIESFCEGATWAKQLLSESKNVSIKEIYSPIKDISFCVFQSAAQHIKEKGVNKESIHLILTDPPYADQAPYLEYSELWNKLLFAQAGSAHYSEEIVKTDAPSRKQDSLAYINRLSLALRECCDCLKTGGYFAFFYQDRSLEHWAKISNTLNESKMSVVDVLALPKQRRSLKTVTTPGRTLDGDLLVIARKSKEHTIRKTKKISIPKTKKTLFDKYAYLIREGLINESLDPLIKLDSDVFSLIAKLN